MMGMVDGVALVVDAFDGPMTQTKYVLSKAIKKGLKAFVVLNKMDRINNPSRVSEVENEVFDLFVTLGASEAQLEFPFVYASARSGWASLARDATEDQRTDLAPLFETIISHIPAPNVKTDAPFSMLVTNIERNAFFGKMLLGKIHSGSVRPGDTLHAVDPTGKSFETIKVTKILCKRGLEQVTFTTTRRPPLFVVHYLDFPNALYVALFVVNRVFLRKPLQAISYH
jgi:GTP-binding protein